MKENGTFWLAAGLIVLLCICGIRIFDHYQVYINGDQDYERLRTEAIVMEETRPKETSGSQGAPTEKERGQAQPSPPVKGIDFAQVKAAEGLKACQDDIVGWILFEEPAEINYPLVQGEDNQEYLSRTLDADGHKYGTIFIDCENRSDLSDPNTFIYGHHMKNGSMFAQLLKYEDPDFYRSYPYFYIYVPDDTKTGTCYTYQIFAVERAQDGGPSFQIDFTEGDTFLEYLSYLKQNREYDTGVEVREDDTIVSLSTCSGGIATERFVVHGLRLK